MAQSTNSTGNPPVNLDNLVPLALAIVMKTPFLADKTLIQVSQLVLAGPISDNTTIDGFVDLVHGFLPPDNKIPNLRKLVSCVFNGVPHMRSYVQSAVDMMPSGEDYRRDINITLWTTLAITGIVLICRVWSRLLLMKRLLLCDYIILFGFAQLVAFTGICTYATQNGVGCHVWDVIYSQIRMAAKLAYIGEIIYRPALLAVKLSLLLFYPTLCRDKPFLIAVHTVTAIQLIHFVGGQFAIIFQCKPMHFWNNLSSLDCIDRYTAYMTLGITNVILDAAIFALPLYIVVGLKMSLREKLLSALLFCIGSSVCIVSILRIQTLTGLTKGLDFTWVKARAGLCCALEVNLAIICASVPSLRALASYYSTPKEERKTKPKGTQFGVPAAKGTRGFLWWRRPSSVNGSTKKIDRVGSIQSNDSRRSLRSLKSSTWRSARTVDTDPAHRERSPSLPPPPIATYPGPAMITTCEAVPKIKRKPSRIANLQQLRIDSEKRVELDA